MPTNYVSLINPPAWLIVKYEELSEKYSVRSERLMGMVLRYACEHKDDFAGELPSAPSSDEAIRGNICIPAVMRIKKCLTAWGRVFGRKRNEQTMFILKKFLSIQVSLEEVSRGYSEVPSIVTLRASLKKVTGKPRQARGPRLGRGMRPGE